MFEDLSNHIYTTVFVFYFPITFGYSILTSESSEIIRTINIPDGLFIYLFIYLVIFIHIYCYIQYIYIFVIINVLMINFKVVISLIQCQLNPQCREFLKNWEQFSRYLATKHDFITKNDFNTKRLRAIASDNNTKTIELKTAMTKFANNSEEIIKGMNEIAKFLWFTRVDFFDSSFLHTTKSTRSQYSSHTKPTTRGLYIYPHTILNL